MRTDARIDGCARGRQESKSPSRAATAIHSRSSSWALVLALACLPAAARADGHALSVRIGNIDVLQAGQPAAIDVWVEVSDGSPLPILLTPSIEGDAVSAVRGRLLRADAEVSPAGLRFRVPLMVRTEGTAILRVLVESYACDKVCRPVRASAAKTLRARPSA